MSNRDSSNIREQMARIRRELDEDVGAVVEHAKELTNWKSLVRRHPLLTVAAATAVGFLVVPKRLNVISPSAEELEKLAKKNRLVVRTKPDVRRQAGVLNPLVNLLGGAIMRSAFTFAGQKIGKVMNDTDAMSSMGHESQS